MTGICHIFALTILLIKFVMTKQPDNDTEHLILQAAEHEFMTKGFAGARTTSIAEAAGVTHAMLHYYFRTKEKLFEKIISCKIAQLKAAVAGAVNDMNAPLAVILRDIINNHMEFISSNPLLPNFLIGEILSNSERSRSFLDELQKFTPPLLAIIQDKIDREAELGLCRKVNAKMLMLDIVSLNVFPYVASPIINAALDNCMTDVKAFLELRKEENYNTIMQKIKL